MVRKTPNYEQTPNYKLKGFMNVMLRKMFGSKRNAPTGGG
jgi:hypothetical protein